MSEVVAAEMLRAVLTKKGKEAATQAATLGKPVKIAFVGVTGTPGTPNDAMTSLPGEVGGRQPIADGKVVSTNQVNVSVLLPDTFPSVNICGVGYYLEDGTLFSVYIAQSPLLIHTMGTTLLIGMDFVLENVPDGSVAVESTGANLIMGDWVPTHRKLNGYVLDKDITLTAKDVKAAPEGFGLGANGVGAGGTSRFLASSVSNTPGLPGLGAGFQSTYGGNRRAQMYVTTDGLTRSRFSRSDDVNDSATPWALHYTTLNKPAPSELGAVPVRSVEIGSGADFNNYEETNNYNVYRSSDGTFNNAPEGFDYGTLQVIGRNKGFKSFVTQIATCKVTTRQWVRTRNDGSFAWGSWRKVYSEAQKPSPADIGAAASSHTHQDYVPKTRTVNGKPLTSDVTITLEDLGFQDTDLSGYVPNTRTVNNKPLDKNISLNHSDVGAAPTGFGLGSEHVLATNPDTVGDVSCIVGGGGASAQGPAFFDQTAPLLQMHRPGGADGSGKTLQIQGNGSTLAFRRRELNSWSDWVRCYTPFNKPSPSELGAAAASHAHSDLVPNTRKVNKKELKGDITLNAADVGAQAATSLVRSTNSYQVSAATPRLLLGADGKEVVKTCAYLVRLLTTTTSTVTGNVYTLRSNNGGDWILKAIALAGTNSNNPLLVISSSGKPQIEMPHPSTYAVTAIMEEFDQRTHGGRPWADLEHFYSPDNKPTPADLGAVRKEGDSALGRMYGLGFTTASPDGKDSVAFEYIDGVPVIRYGGSGTGSMHGLRVMGAGNKVKVLLGEDGEIFAKGDQKVFHPQHLPTAAQIGALPTKAFSQSNNYCTVAIPLIPKASDAADRFNLHRLHGHLHFRRGGSGQTNRMEVLSVNVQVAYSQTYGHITNIASSSGWNFRLCEFMHKGKVWLGLISSHPNAQDFEAVWAGIDVWAGAPAGYDKVDQFSVVAVERTGSPSESDAVLNAEIKNSLKLWGVDYLKDGEGYRYVSGSRKVNGKELSGDIDLTAGDVGALPLNGTAAQTAKLATPRQINGTNFDGQGNITTAKWGTMRYITIGGATMGLDGSGNVTWTLAQIGAASPTDVNNAVNNATNWVEAGFSRLGHIHSAQEGNWDLLANNGHAGQIGSYALLQCSADVAPTTIVSGSNLRWASCDSGALGGPLGGGSWKALGVSTPSNVYGRDITLYIRIA